MIIILDGAAKARPIRFWLEARGIRVLIAGVNAPIHDHQIEALAEKLDAVIVTTDRDFQANPRAIIIPQEWFKRYNKRELATRIVKLATVKYRRLHNYNRGR